MKKQTHRLTYVNEWISSMTILPISCRFSMLSEPLPPLYPPFCTPSETTMPTADENHSSTRQCILNLNPHMNTHLRRHTETYTKCSPKVTTIANFSSSHDGKSQQLEITGSYHGLKSIVKLILPPVQNYCYTLGFGHNSSSEHPIYT